MHHEEHAPPVAEDLQVACVAGVVTFLIRRLRIHRRIQRISCVVDRWGALFGLKKAPDVHRPEEAAADADVEREGGEDEHGAAPSVVLLQESEQHRNEQPGGRRAQRRDGAREGLVLREVDAELRRGVGVREAEAES